MITRALLISFILLLPASQVRSEQAPVAPEGWQLELVLQPLADEHSQDVINLVPKQSIMMKAYVWYPTTRTWIVDYPDWDMPGASIEKLHTPVTNLQRQHEGQQQYGHTRNYILTPVDVGTLQLRQEGLDISASKTGLEVVPLSTPVRVHVELPEGVYSIEQFLPAYALDVEQGFYHYTPTSPAVQLERGEVSELTLGKGEMLERRITINAQGIRGSSIPRYLVPGNQHSSQSESHSQDINGMFGFEGGRRVESLFYTSDAGGRIELDQVDIEWWDLNDEKLQAVSLPGVSFDSITVEAYEEAIGLSWWERNSGRLFNWLASGGIIVGVLLVVYLVFRGLLDRAWKRAKEFTLSVLQSEALAFARLCMAVLLGTRKRATKSFISWQYQNGIRSVPEELSRFFYACDEVDSHDSSPGRFRVLILCWKLRKSPQGKPRNRYRLPDLLRGKGRNLYSSKSQNHDF